jgi:Tfp pilus assembly protein PilW
MKKNLMPIPGKQKGFTLIELLVYGVVFSLLLLLITQVFLTVKSISANSLAMINLQQNLNRVFTDFNQTIRNADTVDYPAAGTGDASLSIDSGAVVYQVSAGHLTKVSAGVPVNLTDDGVTVTGISFSNVSEATMPAVIRINVDFQSNYLLTAGRQIEENLETTIGVR